MGFKRIAARGQEAQVAVRDAVEGVTGSLPTVDVSRFKQLASRAGAAVLQGASTAIGAIDDFTQAAGEKVVDVAGKAMDVAKIATSKPAQFLLDDIVMSDEVKNATPIDNSWFDDAHIDLLANAAREKLTGDGSSATISYEDWNKAGANVALGTGEQSSRVSASELAAGIGNPANDLKQMLGAAKVYVDENGDMILEDRYNFNYYYDPVLEREVNAEQWAMFDATARKEAMKSVLFDDKMSFYDKVRNLSFMFGSKDYQGADNPRDEGRQIRVNLGKYNVQPEQSQ